MSVFKFKPYHAAFYYFLFENLAILLEKYDLKYMSLI